MKIQEVVSGLNWFVANVRVVLPEGGSMNTRVAIRCDTLMSARYLLSRIYGKKNIGGISQTLDEEMLIDEPLNGEEVIMDNETFGADNKTLTPQQLQVKSLKDKSKELNNQAKRVQAQTQLSKAQAKLSKANKAAVSS